MHAWDQPAEALLELGPKAGARLMMPRLGQPVEPAHVGLVEPWWRVVDTNAREPEPDAPAAITMPKAMLLEEFAHADAERLLQPRLPTMTVRAGTRKISSPRPARMKRSGKKPEQDDPGDPYRSILGFQVSQSAQRWS